MLRFLLGFALFACAAPAVAAESYDNCTGTVGTLPVTLTTPGVWCLKSDLATGITSGVAITIAANNVTLDCNGFRVGGLAAGLGTAATGINAFDRSNVTLRNCNVRGFLFGLYLFGGSGHVIEDNRFDGNTDYGIRLLQTEGADVRRNFVGNTGGSFDAVWHNATGILVDGGRAALIRNNFISAVSPDVSLWPSATSVGLFVSAPESVVDGNRIAGVASGGSGVSVGIWSFTTQVKLMDNTVSGLAGSGRQGINCAAGVNTLIARNLVSGAGPGLGFINCIDGGGNIAQ